MSDAPSIEILRALEAGHGIRVRRVDAIAPEKYEWLWDVRVPAAGLTVFSGPGDAGKSTIYTDLAARVSSGRSMPGEPEGVRQAGNVLILASEDHHASVVRPRLEAARADMSRVCLIDCCVRGGEEVPLVFDEFGIRRLGNALDALRPRLLVVDPFTNHLPVDVDQHLDQHVRRVLGPIARRALGDKFAALVVRHFTQNKKRALDRARGAPTPMP